MDSTLFWYNVCEYDFFTERERVAQAISFLSREQFLARPAMAWVAVRRERHLREREHVVAALSRDTRRATCTYRHTVCVFSQLSKKPKIGVLYGSRQY